MRRAGWRPYGFVEALGSTIRLFNFSGLVDVAERLPAVRVVFVETWFGEGAAEFRVASLHKFALSIRSGSPALTGQVRFALPRQSDSRTWPVAAQPLAFLK